jgi:hypothetical protein
MDSKLKRNNSLDLEGSQWVMDAVHGEGMLESSTGLEKSTGETRKGRNCVNKDRSTDTSGNGTDGDHKRDPRVERRIRNKVKVFTAGL